MDPLIKWPGGKRRLAHNILAALDPEALFHVEPFAGGAAVALAAPAHQGLVLNDASHRLMNLYESVRDTPAQVISALRAYPAYWNHDFYHSERVLFNRRVAGPTQAARLIFLNKTGFNGLYRENGRGEYNVPPGDSYKVRLPSSDAVLALHDRLIGARLSHGDFSAVTVPPFSNVYCDPPYLPPPGKKTSFTGYSHPFGPADHVRLAAWLRLQAFEQDATCVVSNVYTEECQRIYNDFEVVWQGDVRRSISCGDRVPVPEVILRFRRAS